MQYIELNGHRSLKSFLLCLNNASSLLNFISCSPTKPMYSCYIPTFPKQYQDQSCNNTRNSYADLHLFQTRFVIGWENNRDGDKTMPLSMKTIGSAGHRDQ